MQMSEIPCDVGLQLSKVYLVNELEVDYTLSLVQHGSHKTHHLGFALIWCRKHSKEYVKFH